MVRVVGRKSTDAVEQGGTKRRHFECPLSSQRNVHARVAKVPYSLSVRV